ncbi:MAG: HAMP domain-containing histidine kinase [Lachnospiraceae bacterium]|nr:HAMP domain-containing histidine kinase [Lachnospiraceae bacterium]
MKRFWNWKTALVGVFTSLIFTVIAGGAYFGFCEYLWHEKKNLEYEVTQIILDEDVEEFQGEQVVSVTEANYAEDSRFAPTEDVIRQLQGYHFVLFKELSDKKMAKEGKEPHLRYQDLLYGERPALEFPEELSEEECAEYQAQYEAIVSDERECVENYLSSMERDGFARFNSNYDYWVFDNDNPREPLTNTDITDLNELSRLSTSGYAFLYRIDYDEYGVPALSDQSFAAADSEMLRRNINSVLHERTEKVLGGFTHVTEGMPSFLRDGIEKACKIKNPAGCKIVIGITWNKYQTINEPREWDENFTHYFREFGSFSVVTVCFVLIGLAACCGVFYLNSRHEERRAKRVLARAPFELVAALVMLIYSAEYTLHSWMTSLFLQLSHDYVSAGLFVFFLFFVTWYVGGCLGEIRVLGFRKYFEKRCLVVIVFCWIREHVRKLFNEYKSLNLGMDLRWKVLRIVVLNLLIMAAFCCCWFLGIAGVIIYSIFLYFLVMRYIVNAQKDYQELKRMTLQMSEGNLKYEPQKSLGLFEPVKEDLVQIRNGFDKAVQEEVRSHKMKTELITNVSHDLKTPLTAIITYVNLLKEKNLTEEQIQSYVDTLDKKSLRLKRLIEDLFEVSKANSGNVQLNLQTCDLANLIKQCFYELEGQFEEKKLTTRLSMPEGKILLKLDSEKTYRIYENLFNNIVKYAMSGTRVYLSMVEEKDTVVVTVKNITEAELYVPAEELTERFVRGDASRGSIEGSGLGLAIARSFTEIQGGKFEIDVDGDLFKVTTTWRKPWGQEAK